MAETGFTTMTGAKAAGNAPEVGVGMLGYAFMGKAHSNAYKKLPYMMYPPVAIPKLIAICGRNEDAAKEAAQRYGYEGYYTDWRQMLKDDRIQLFDNGGPNNAHAEPCIEAAKAGKHIICEKPLARTAKEAASMLEAVTKAGVKHAVAFNYRFVPAVRLAKDLIDAGKLGQIYHYRAVYLQEWVMPHYGTPMIWRLNKETGGQRRVGRSGRAHHRSGTLPGRRAAARERRWRRPSSRNGPVRMGRCRRWMWTMPSCRPWSLKTGQSGRWRPRALQPVIRTHNCFEINGEKGSIRFDLERLNELEVFWVGEEPKETQGFHQISVTEGYHPFWSNWWPHGHIIGWEHTFVHEINHLLDAIVNNKDVAPFGATFEDGYKNAVICDAILESADSGLRVDVKY